MKRYTANEMRELAEMIDHGGAFALTDPSIVEANVAMLRQAAEDLEREEREKNYEYTTMFEDGEVSGLHYLDIEPLKHGLHANHRMVRREVGDWEEVEKDEK